MYYRPHCIPCFLRRTLHTAEIATSDEWLHRKILGEIMAEINGLDVESTPAEVVLKIFRKSTRALGMADPYAEEKKEWQKEVLANQDWIRKQVDGSSDPFFTALKLSTSANQLDNELRPVLTLKGLVEGLSQVRFEPENFQEFREVATRAKKILFIHDAAGELFFDRLLMEKLDRPPSVITSVVRQLPVITDATLEDTEAVGLSKVAAEIIDPGIDCQGIPLSDCSEEFREHFHSSDLIIVKGQAGYQTLADEDFGQEDQEKNLFFLLAVKCPVMATQLGVGLGDLVLERN